MIFYPVKRERDEKNGHPMEEEVLGEDGGVDPLLGVMEGKSGEEQGGHAEDEVPGGEEEVE